MIISKNVHVAEELHKPVITKFEWKKVYGKFKTIFGYQI